MGGCNVFFRCIDAITLTLVFLFQNVILNMFLIRDWNGSVVPYFCFLVDFIILLVFYLTLYLVGTHFYREKKALKRAESAALHGGGDRGGGVSGGTLEGSSADGSSSVGGGGGIPRPTSRTSNNRSLRVSEYNFTVGMTWIHRLTRNFPMAYVCWLVYSWALIAKIFLLFKNEVPQHLGKEDFFGPQMFTFVIGLTALVFSLIVAAHKNARSDHLRNAYLNNLCYRIALEILDSASFLSLLIPAESHLMYTYNFEDVILVLASINLFLPCMTLYKLCATDFGRRVSYPIEMWYKFIHLILVDGTFMMVRIYLWSMYSVDTSIFLIKNIYAIANFGREMRGDFRDMKTYCCQRKEEDEVELGGHGMAAVDIDDNVSGDSSIGDMRMHSMNKEPSGYTSSDVSILNDVSRYNWKKKDGSISTRGMHGSGQSSLVQVYAINAENTNGHAPTVAMDDSNSQVDVGEDTTSLMTQDESQATDVSGVTHSEGQVRNGDKGGGANLRHTFSQP